MTLDSAKATAIGMTSRFGADFAVFRLAGWVDGEYGVRRADELPKEAEIAETFKANVTVFNVVNVIERCDHKFVDTTVCLKCGIGAGTLTAVIEAQRSLFGD